LFPETIYQELFVAYYWIRLLSFPSNTSLGEKPDHFEIMEMGVTATSCYKIILLRDIPATY